MMQVVLAQALSRAEQKARPDLVTRLVSWGRGRFEQHRQRRLYRRTVQTLGRLDDRTLHDIGLERSEITSYATRGGEHRHPARRFVPRYITPMY